MGRKCNTYRESKQYHNKKSHSILNGFLGFTWEGGSLDL